MKLTTCEAGHKTHDRVSIFTVVADKEISLQVYDWEKYQGFNGYCTGQCDVSRTLLNTGRWEASETATILSILRGGNRAKLVIDIGAHIGWYSIIAAKLGYKVIAYEADAENCEVLGRNALLNQVPQLITINHEWIGEDTIPREFPDTILAKMDIEGNEQYGVQLLSRLLEEKRADWLFLEISPVFNDSYGPLIAILENYGYRAYRDGKPFDGNLNFDQDNFLFRPV